MKQAPFIAIFALVLLVPLETQGFDDTGHQVVAGIAWEQMTPEARREAVRLLRAAPPRARMLRWLPQDGRPLGVRERELFMGAATWPDKEIRNDHRFDDWHFLNLYWEQQTPTSRPRIRPGSTGEIVKKLTEFERSLRQRRGSDQERGIELVWMLHLFGDIHQPLHCSARITPEDPAPRGDLGGNLFRLRRQPAWNLHKHWDNILDVSYPGQNNSRIVRTISRRHPVPSGNLRLSQYQGWAIVSRDKAIQVAYPATLVRGQMPSSQYSAAVSAVVEPSIALAGARLAATLNRILVR